MSTASHDYVAVLPGPLTVEQRMVLRASLEARVRVLRHEIGAAIGPSGHDEPPHLPSSYGDADAPVADVEVDLGIAAIERDAHELADVADALRRLDTTVFGQCPDCGEPIAWERLRALPQVRRCAHCETDFERTSPSGSTARL